MSSVRTRRGEGQESSIIIDPPLPPSGRRDQSCRSASLAGRSLFFRSPVPLERETDNLRVLCHEESLHPSHSRFASRCSAGKHRPRPEHAARQSPPSRKRPTKGPFDAREALHEVQSTASPCADGAKLFTAVLRAEGRFQAVPVPDGAHALQRQRRRRPRRPGQLRRRSFPARQPPPRPLGGFRPGGLHLRVPGRARTV